MRGFYISKVVATGEDKINAVINLVPGSNVICGYSDTGKSFIFDCINFAFGSQDTIDVPPEGEGYLTVYVEISTYANTPQIWTIKRDFGDKEIWLYECAFANISAESKPQIIKSTHHDNQSSISSFLLTQSGFPPTIILPAKLNGEVSAFSFRNLWSFLAVNEINILEKKSPILNKTVYNKTFQRYAFDYVLTGDGAVERVKKSSARKQNNAAHFAAQIELCNQWIEELARNLVDLEEQKSGYGVENYEEADIEALTAAIADSGEIINKKLAIRQSLLNKLEEIQLQINGLEQMKARFSLLSFHYKSDLERLDFVSEGQFLLNQLQESMCPSCGRSVSEVGHDHAPAELNDDLVQLACASEIEKISRNLSELEETFNGLEERKEGLYAEAKTISGAIAAEEKDLQSSLSIKWNNDKRRLIVLLSNQRVIGEIESVSERLKALRITQADLKKKSAEDKAAAAPVQSGEAAGDDVPFKAAIKQLEQRMTELLIRWKFETEPVKFDSKACDFKIGEKARRSFGAGKRGVIYSAYLISLLDSLVSTPQLRPHPRFILIDSPLTNHKGRKKLSKKDLGDDKELTEEVKDAFFSYLADVQPTIQIIIIENDVPAQTYRSSVHTVEFSDSLLATRAGFFPEESVSDT